MKVRHRKGLANHPGPESCGGAALAARLPADDGRERYGAAGL